MSEDFDENRELCSDGNCLGVIVDGRCNVCGLRADGPGISDFQVANSSSATAAGDGINDSRVANDDFDDRQLCPDGACTGLIGSDGKCKVCRRSAAS